MSLSTPSIWQRSRQATSLACGLAGAMGLGLVSQGHHLHGVLALLACTVLLRSSVLSHRARRRAAVANLRRAYHGVGH
jgi:hypothetical protein